MEVPTFPLTRTILTETSIAHNMPKKGRFLHKMASEPELLEFSGLAKVKEFLKLKYPRYVVKAACSYMAASTGERAWLSVRDKI